MHGIVILERRIVAYPLRINSSVYKIGNCYCYNYCYWPTFRGGSRIVLTLRTIHAVVSLRQELFIPGCKPQAILQPPVYYSQLIIHYVEIKCQLDATDDIYCRSYCLLNMFRVTIMPIIRSSRALYKWLLPVVFGAWFSSCRYGVELRV